MNERLLPSFINLGSCIVHNARGNTTPTQSAKPHRRSVTRNSSRLLRHVALPLNPASPFLRSCFHNRLLMNRYGKFRNWRTQNPRLGSLLDGEEPMLHRLPALGAGRQKLVGLGSQHMSVENAAEHINGLVAHCVCKGILGVLVEDTKC